MKLILGFVSLAAILSMLVPGSVSGQGDFRIFVTDYDAIHELDLKATEGQNGQVNQVSGFAIKANSVVQINQNENLQVFTSTNEPIRVEKVKVTDQSGQLIELSKSGNEWSLQGFDDGVYLLDVIVNMPSGEKGAFETVLVILAPNTQNADPNQVIKQVVKTDTKVVFRDQKPKPKPIGNPYCDLVTDDYRGACHDRKDYDEETGLYPCRDGSDVKDWRDCKDAGKHPAERLKKTYPEPIACPTGHVLSSDGISCAPPCDGTYQDCIYNGHFCKAGSPEHACELPLEEVEEVEAQPCGALLTLGCPLGPGLPQPQTCAAGWHLDERNICQPDNPSNPALGFAAFPPCDGSYQDCMYNGHFCKAGSTEHACELPLTDEIPAIANDCLLVPTAPGCGQAIVVPNDPFTVPNVVEEEEISCQPEDDFCEPGCESPSMDCIDDVNIGDDGEDSSDRGDNSGDSGGDTGGDEEAADDEAAADDEEAADDEAASDEGGDTGN
jgi:hypothetical protein